MGWAWVLFRFGDGTKGNGQRFFIAGVYGMVSALVLYCSIHSYDIFFMLREVPGEDVKVEGGQKRSCEAESGPLQKAKGPRQHATDVTCKANPRFDPAWRDVNSFGGEIGVKVLVPGTPLSVLR